MQKSGLMKQTRGIIFYFNKMFVFYPCKTKWQNGFSILIIDNYLVKIKLSQVIINEPSLVSSFKVQVHGKNWPFLAF